jgi:hypothetical protein
VHDVPAYQQDVRESFGSLGIGGLWLSQKTPLGSALALSLFEGAVDGDAVADGAALALATGVVTGVVSAGPACPQAHTHASMSERNEGIAPPYSRAWGKR